MRAISQWNVIWAAISAPGIGMEKKKLIRDDDVFCLSPPLYKCWNLFPGGERLYPFDQIEKDVVQKKEKVQNRSSRRPSNQRLRVLGEEKPTPPPTPPSKKKKKEGEL